MSTQIQKPSVSIGIPAHNEAGNIKRLLESVLSQKEEMFTLKEVIVVSDGSTDRTVAEALSVSDARIRVIDVPERGGKTARFKDLQSQYVGDILIQFDADVVLEHADVINAMISTMQVEHADLMCARIVPLLPRTYVERLAYFGVKIGERCLEYIGDKHIAYRCQGRGRLFTKNYLEHFSFPADVGSGEDVYSFLYAMTHGYKVAYADRARVLYRLPSTRADFIKQSRRFISTPSTLARYFPLDMVKEYFENVPDTVKIKCLLGAMLSNLPHISFGYILSQIVVHLTARPSDPRPLWDNVASTKTLG